MTEASHKDIERIAKPGDILAGKYLVERLLGVGGMGAVFAATHTQLDQRVAVKVLLPSMLENREVVERFQREARAAAKIKSEHVVRVSDVGTLESGAPFIVMELLEGRDLGDLLAKRGPLPIPLAVDYILEATEALAEAHAAGIVHRDLKPGNLFLARRPDESEIIKVLDFGISKQLGPEVLQSSPSLTKTTDVFGSPTYMSPEQLKASRDVDMRADVWALGVILYELLAGAPPFGGGTVAEIFGAILHKPAPRIRETRKDVPSDLERLLLRCLEKEASDRFQNVGDLAEALSPHGSDGARASTARISRVLGKSGGHPRPSLPDARASRPDDVPLAGAVEASTGAPAAKIGADPLAPAANAGSSTSTSWGHVRPTQRSSSGRTLLLVGGIVAAAAAGAFIVLRVLAPAGNTSTTAQPVSPSAEPPPATATVASTVVTPALTSTTDPSAAPSAVPTVVPASAAPATGSAPRPTAKLPAAAPTLAPSVQPASPTPDPPKVPPAGDDEFGGRR